MKKNSKCNTFNRVKAGKGDSLKPIEVIMYNNCGCQNAYECDTIKCPNNIDNKLKQAPPNTDWQGNLVK